MADSELGRLTSIGRTAKLIAALLSGRDLTRAEITALLGVRVAAADRQIAAIGRHVPLIREKRRGRLNCIAHLLRSIPYKRVPHTKVKLPKRSGKGRYDDQSTLKGRNFVRERY